jgi:hypothetical protein
MISTGPRRGMLEIARIYESLATRADLDPAAAGGVALTVEARRRDARVSVPRRAVSEQTRSRRQQSL